MKVTHTKIEKNKEDASMNDTNVKKRLLAVMSDGMCDNGCVCAADTDDNNVVWCKALERMCDAHKVEPTCPFIDADTYKQQLIEEYLEQLAENKETEDADKATTEDSEMTYENINDSNSNHVSDVTFESCMKAYVSVADVVSSMIKDKVVDNDTAYSLIWGALLLVHNVDPERLPLHALNQLLGEFVSKPFRGE